MKTICIRVDGNKDIATGHIGRCLSIARVFNFPYTENIITQNAVIFIVSDENSKKILEERFEKTDNFQIFVLNTMYKDMKTELPALIDYLGQVDCSCLFIDSYFVTEEYLKNLHEALKIKGCKLAYIDDLQQLSHYDTDVIINYGVTNTPEKYADVPTKLIGPKFTPLRAQFSSTSSASATEISTNSASATEISTSTASAEKVNASSDELNIFISSGGIDTQNMSVSLIEAVRKQYLDSSLQEANSKKLIFHVLTSKLNSHFDELISLSENAKNDNGNTIINIYEGVSDVASIMNKCDVAISAGGTTLSELCALGIPTISYLNADNQRKGIEEFDKNGIIPYAGDVTGENKKDAVINNILNILDKICNSTVNERREISNKMKNYIDGMGAKRIADELTK